MFGYVAADRAALTDTQMQRYRGCYCGLCRAIGRSYGWAQRASLNYDMTFLVLLLSSLYEPEEQAGEGRCAVHPLQRYGFWQTAATDYGAAMNITLAYYSCLDHWQDDKSVSGFLESRLFRPDALAVLDAYPRQGAAVEACLNTLAEIEAANLQEPDLGANAFGRLMGALFLWKEDRWSPLLQQMGQALGRFIYLMDAVLDLPADQKKGRYNPLTQMAADGRSKEDFRPMLTLLIGECTEAFEQLPLVQDVDLLRNILYSGVWTRFHMATKPDKEA